MFWRKILLCFCLTLMISANPALAANSTRDEGWTPIAPGIEYQKFQLPDPNNVFVARMDRSNPSVTLESTIAQGKMAGAKETVSDMYARYDQAINYWGGSENPPSWGMRNQVVVAINGAYFDMTTGLAKGGQIYSGWYAKEYSDLGGGSGFTWMLDRSAFIGDCIYHRPEKQLVTFPATGKTERITDINTTRPQHGLVLYTPQYDSRTGTDGSGAEVIIEMTRPTMILPSPSYASGIVRQVHPNEGNSLIPFNSIVLSASGLSYVSTLIENAQVGSEIRISQEITSYKGDCSTSIQQKWTKAYAAVEGAFSYLEDGKIHDYDAAGAKVRNPRTAIAYNDDYIYFIVVDGRDYAYSVGMTIHELAEFTRDRLGATWGEAEDGGGSSTMVINGVVVNNSYCNNYSCAGTFANAQDSVGAYTPIVDQHTESKNIREVFNRLSPFAAYLALVAREEDLVQNPPAIYQDVYGSQSIPQRPVANGMMMVIALPAEYSTNFYPTEYVTAMVDIEMHLGPGTNYASFTSIPGGAQGTIMLQMNGLNGVLAKSTHWWYVDFGGVRGWVPEQALTGQREFREQTEAIRR